MGAEEREERFFGLAGEDVVVALVVGWFDVTFCVASSKVFGHLCGTVVGEAELMYVLACLMLNLDICSKEKRVTVEMLIPS